MSPWTYPGAEIALKGAPHETSASGGPPSDPGSTGGADAVLPCAAHGAHGADGAQGGASVLHCYLFDIPRAGLGPALQAVDFDGVGGVWPLSKGSCSGGCHDYSQMNPSRRIWQTGRSLHSEIARILRRQLRVGVDGLDKLWSPDPGVEWLVRLTRRPR